MNYGWLSRWALAEGATPVIETSLRQKGESGYHLSPTDRFRRLENNMLYVLERSKPTCTPRYYHPPMNGIRGTIYTPFASGYMVSGGVISGVAA